MKRAILLATVFLASSLRADVVLQADFRGEAGGTGGEKDFVTVGGNATITGLPGNTVMVTTESPDLGAGPYLRTNVSADAPSGAPQAGVRITPSSPANSLGAMFTSDHGPALNGGFDFFYRTNLDVTDSSNDHVMRAIDVDNRKNDGLSLIFLSQQGALRMDINAPDGGIDGGSQFQGNFKLKANAVYHFGVTFKTDDSHVTTAKIFAVEGAGAINTEEEKNVVATGTFVLNKEVVKAGFAADAFEFGAIYNDNKPKQQDFGRLRIYNAVPKEFEALSAAPPAATTPPSEPAKQ